MFRLLLSFIYLALTIIGATAVYLGVDDAAEPIDTRLESGVQVGYVGYNHVKRLRDLQLRDTAAGLARSELQAYVAVLEDNRNKMLKLEAEVYGAVPGEADDENLTAERRKIVEQKEEFVSAFAESLAQRIEAVRGKGAWEKQPRAEFVTETRETLVSCNARAVSECFHRFTFHTLERLAKQLRHDNTYGLRPDLVVLTDDRGTGLADADNQKWSNDTRFAERHALMRKVREGGIPRDVMTLEGSDAYYFVAAAPLFEGEKFRGAILVGVEIDDGLLREESRALGWQVSYAKNRSLIRSLLPDDLRAELSNALPGRKEEATRTTTRTENLVLQVVPLSGNYAAHDIAVVLSGNRADAMAPIESIRALIPLYGLMMFLVGMALFLWIIRTYTKPLVDIDTGIHEIMNGNHDYEFEAEYQDKLWSSMAQSLNRMVGILLGRELEDEDLEAYLGVQTRQPDDES